jgi:selenide,water dikinase
MVHPKKVMTNAGGRPGDVLVLTKPIGFGIVTTAAKQERDSAGAVAEVVRLMSTLNRSAAQAMATVRAHACTDVTGFGLLGHLRNLTAASGCAATVHLDRVPVVEAARRYVREAIAPGGTHANWRFLNDWTSYAPDVDKDDQLLLCDAQTSGGLLIAVDPRDADALCEKLESLGVPAAARVGTLEGGRAGQMQVTR